MTVTIASVAMGSNLEDREQILVDSLICLAQLEGVVLRGVSKIYETDPVGLEDQPPFLNAVVCLETDRVPRDLLTQLLEIEAHFGRVRSGPKNSARTLDLDLLQYGDLVCEEPGLMLPHPRLHQRAFVLIPFAEVCPEWCHPLLAKTVAELRADLVSDEGVRLCSDALHKSIL